MKLKVSRFDNIGLDFCFDLPSNFGGKMVVPKLKFHFKRVDLELPTENYMVGDSGTGVLCLAMAALGSILIFGNVQQQNLLIIHDLERERIKIRESHGHGVYLSPANFAYTETFAVADRLCFRLSPGLRAMLLLSFLGCDAKILLRHSNGLCKNFEDPRDLKWV
ncbi:hypothetical protein LguiA_013808 [Lonicera macranthoides]